MVVPPASFPGSGRFGQGWERFRYLHFESASRMGSCCLYGARPSQRSSASDGNFEPKLGAVRRAKE
jgi:hypothetical protein